MSIEDSFRYRRFVKPELGRLFEALRLDVVYREGRGDVLKYRDAEGADHEVLDFLGGYGASLFGHNHPRLVNSLCRALERGQVFNAQKSCRGAAGALGERLSALVARFTAQSYVATFTNSGAEAVEAALKHATMAYHERCAREQLAFARANAKLADRWRRGTIRLAPDFAVQLETHLPRLGATLDPKRVEEALLHGARIAFARPPLFIALDRAFHGLTTGALRMTANARYRTPFDGPGIDSVRLAPNSEPALRAALDDACLALPELAVIAGQLHVSARSCSRVAALFVETLQGEGGIRSLHRGYLTLLRERADSLGFHLVCDEIQSGMGRTGTFLHCEQAGLRPDYVLLGKSLGGGLTKLACLLVDRRLYCDEFGIAHSSTFAEDDLSAGVALEALSLLEEEQLLARCRETGALAKRELEALARRYPEVIEQVRGEGLMLGLGLRDFRYSPSLPLQMLAEQEMLGYLMSGYLLHVHGVRVGPTLSHAGTIRIEPSAYVSGEQIGTLLAALDDLCQRLRDGDVARLVAYLLPAAEARFRELDRAPARAQVAKAWSERLPRSDPALDSLPQVAFLAHFASSDDIPDWEPSFARLTRAEREALLDRVHDVLEPMVHDRTIIQSITGQAVCMNVIGLCVDARLMSQYVRGRDRKLVLRHLELAVARAEELGCSVVGLGGYTSIVAGNGLLLRNQRAALTTGNSLTVGMGLASIQRSAEALGMSLRGSRFAAVGAGGNIASLYSELIAEHVGSAHLIGRSGSLARVEEAAGRVLRSACAEIARYMADLCDRPGGVAAALLDTRVPALLRENLAELDDAQLYRLLAGELGARCPVTIGAELSALRKADVILSASNAPDPVLLPEMIGDQLTIICDISVPPDADPNLERLRPNARVIQGGVVRMPKNPEFHPPGSPLPPGRCYACLAETALLGLEGVNENFSYGAITRERVELATAFARKHGFVLAEADLQKRGYNEFSRNIATQIS